MRNSNGRVAEAKACLQAAIGEPARSPAPPALHQLQPNPRQIRRSRRQSVSAKANPPLRRIQARRRIDRRS
jgi:hypothetical protein